MELFTALGFAILLADGIDRRLGVRSHHHFPFEPVGAAASVAEARHHLGVAFDEVTRRTPHKLDGSNSSGGKGF